MRNLEWYDGTTEQYCGFSAEGGFGESVVGTVSQTSAGDWTAFVRVAKDGSRTQKNLGYFPTKDEAKVAAEGYAAQVLA